MKFLYVLTYTAIFYVSPICRPNSVSVMVVIYMENRNVASGFFHPETLSELPKDVQYLMDVIFLISQCHCLTCLLAAPYSYSKSLIPLYFTHFYLFVQCIFLCEFFSSYCIFLVDVVVMLSFMPGFRGFQKALSLICVISYSR